MRNHYHLLKNRQLASQARLCDLCGRVSSVSKIRNYAYQTGDALSDGEEMIDMSDGEVDFSVMSLSKDQFDILRVILYPDSSDQVVQQLSQAASVQGVFSIVEGNLSCLTAEQISQAVVTLWDLQKVYGLYGGDFPYLKSLEHSSFIDNIVKHQTFHNLLSRLETVAEALDDNGLSCLLLYLFRLGVSEKLPVMQKLLVLCAKRIDNFSYSALSRISVYLRNQGLRGYYLQSKIVNNVASKFKTISTPEDLKLVTICLNSSSRFLSHSLFREYETLLQTFLREGKLESCEPRMILKILRFLTQKDWAWKPVDLQRQMLILMDEKVHTLRGVEVMALSHYFQDIMEPREVLYKILERVNKLIQSTKSPSRKVNLLLCLAPFSSFENRSDFEELIVENLDDENFSDLIPVIFKCLRSIKTTNFTLCNAFWGKAYSVIQEEMRNVENRFLGIEELMHRKVYQNYMYFNNNLGGTYRNYALERSICEAFVSNLRGQSGLLPHKTARMVSFLLGYSKREGIPRDILEKVLSNASQYSLQDIVLMSRGIQISLALQHSNVRRAYTEQMTSICHILNSCTEKQLKVSDSLFFSFFFYTVGMTSTHLICSHPLMLE